MFQMNMHSANAMAIETAIRRFCPECSVKRRAFWACLFAAVFLNAGLLIALATGGSKPLLQPTFQTVATSMFTIATNSPAKALRPANAVRDTKPQVAIQAAAFGPMVQVEESSASIKESATHFFGYDEVETPARPDTDWNLDASALDALGIERLVFDVFINDAGEVIACTFKEPASLNSDEKEAISARLRMTALTPAVRAGRAVASFRTIDLFVVAGP